MNVDEEGSRCKYFYKRPKHESQRIKLVKPDCKVTPNAVMVTVKDLILKGSIKKVEMYLRDKFSVWGSDRFRLCFVKEEQIRNRLKVKSLEEVGFYEVS